MRHAIPYARAGQCIGLLGGSFDPAHAGHRHITLAALRRFGLDQVWWLVSPGNPLKAHGPAPMAQRLVRAGHIMRHPRVRITDIECRLGTRYTAQTIAALRRLYPQTRFTWLMGADNLAQFHHWKDWRQIMESVPIGVLARPGSRMEGRRSAAAQIYAKMQLKRSQSHLLARAEAPAWCFLNISMTDMSSTELRAKTGWNAIGTDDKNGSGPA